MTDRLPRDTRSRVMKRIRSADTLPEIVVRRYLHAQGLRYRLHDHKLPGRPDLVLPRFRTVVQVYGCFWHQHNDPSCPDARVPDSNQGYWVPKLRRTRERDAVNRERLEEMGWRVEVVWACEITQERLAALTDSIRGQLCKNTGHR